LPVNKKILKRVYIIYLFYQKKSDKSSKKSVKNTIVDKNHTVKGIIKMSFFIAIPIIDNTRLQKFARFRSTGFSLFVLRASAHNENLVVCLGAGNFAIS
jgi:hypothetical protein